MKFLSTDQNAYPITVEINCLQSALADQLQTNLWINARNVQRDMSLPPPHTIPAVLTLFQGLQDRSNQTSVSYYNTFYVRGKMI